MAFRLNILQNTFFLLTARVVNWVMAFVLLRYAARILGDVGFGKYFFAVAYTSLFILLTDLGTNNLLVRDIARDRDNAPSYLGNLFVLKLFLAVGITLLACIIVNLLGYPADTRWTVYGIGLGMIFLTTFGSMAEHVFEAFEQMQYIALVDLVRKTLGVALGILALLLGYGLFGLVLSYLISCLLHAFVGIGVVLKRLTRIRLTIDLPLWGRLIRTAIPFALTLIFTSILVNVDSTMLSLLKGDAVVGWYSAAYRIIIGLNLIPILCMTAVFPVASRLYISSQEQLTGMFHNAFRYMIMLSLPMAVGITLLADKFVLWMYGEQYIQSILALQILAWALAFSFLNYPMITLLNAINRQHKSTLAMGFCTAFNVLINLLFIPALGHIGAAVATVASEVLLFAIGVVLVRRYFFAFPLHRQLVKPVLAGLSMAGFIFLGQEIPLGYMVLGAGAVYFVALLVTRGFTRDDLLLVRKLIPKSELAG